MSWLIQKWTSTLQYQARAATLYQAGQTACLPNHGATSYRAQNPYSEGWMGLSKMLSALMASERFSKYGALQEYTAGRYFRI